jgi:hypothetical protein
MDAPLYTFEARTFAVVALAKSNFVSSPIQHLNAVRYRLKMARLWRDHQGEFPEGLKIRWRPLLEAATISRSGLEEATFSGVGGGRSVSVIALYELPRNYIPRATVLFSLFSMPATLNWVSLGKKVEQNRTKGIFKYATDLQCACVLAILSVRRTGSGEYRGIPSEGYRFKRRRPAGDSDRVK